MYSLLYKLRIEERMRSLTNRSIDLFENGREKVHSVGWVSIRNQLRSNRVEGIGKRKLTQERCIAIRQSQPCLQRRKRA